MFDVLLPFAAAVCGYVLGGFIHDASYKACGRSGSEIRFGASLVNALIWMLVAVTVEPGGIPRALFQLALFEALLFASLTDIFVTGIYDLPTFAATFVGLVFGAIFPRVYPFPIWYPPASVSPHLTGLLGVAVCAAAFLPIAAIVRWRLGATGFGSGDGIIMLLIGAFLGWQLAIASFAVGIVIQIVALSPILRYSKVRFRVSKDLRGEPFVPAIAIGALIVALRPFTFAPPVMAAADAVGPGTLLVMWIFILLTSMEVVKLYHRYRGIDPRAEIIVWTSADQLAFLASSRPRADSKALGPPPSPIRLAGQGLLGEYRWRNR